MWAKQTKQPAAGAEDGSGISTPATAGGSARREDRAGNELLRPSASSDARCSSARHARGVSGSGRNIGESSARYSPRIGDACASFEETIDGKRDEAADGAVTDGASDGASDGGDSDDEFVGLYWTAVEHRQAANAALSTALNRLGVGAKEGRGDACLVGGSTRHGGRSNDAEEFGGGGKVEGLGGRRRRSSSWGNLAESQDPLQAGEGDGSGRFARRQVGQVGCGEGGSGDIATGSGRLGEKETAAAAAAAAAAADFAFPKYGAASNGVACSGDESARPGHRRRHSITCIDTELKELLDLVDLKGEEAAEEAAEEGENGEAAGKSEKEAEHPACREGHQGGMRRNGGNGRNLVRRDTRGRPGAIPTANATVRSPAAAAVASPTGNNPASMRTSNPSPRTHSGQLLANTHAATSASPFARRPARRRSQTCIDTDLKEFLDLIDSDEGDETDEGECVPRDEREGREGGETGKAPDDLPLGYSASSPTPLSPASLISPSASPLTSPSAAAAVAGFPQHAPAALAPNGGASTPKGGAMAVRAAAGGARRGGCAGGDSSRVGVSRSGGVASLATARPANSLRVNGRRLSAGDLSALLGGSSFETSDSDYTSGYATGYPTKDTGVTMAVDVTSSGGGSSSERSRQMCLNEARRIAGVCYPSLAAGSPAPGPPGPSGPAGPASPPGHLAPLGSVGPHAPPRPASIGKLLGGDITRLSESPRTPPRVGQELPGNALPGSACELFPACGKLLRPGTPGVPSLGGAGRAADGAVSNTVAASSSLAAPAGKGSQARAHHKRSSSAVVVPQSFEAQASACVNWQQFPSSTLWSFQHAASITARD
ncbi:unnamed protein product [Closterium sp. NIES-64]|nr:unnamed protein product [Closterium sp. NIES-64]